MYDPHTRESRGFGFVTMESAEEADAVITALNGTDLMGKSMTVEKVRSNHRSIVPAFHLNLPSRLAVVVLGPRLPAGTMVPRNVLIVRSAAVNLAPSR